MTLPPSLKKAESLSNCPQKSLTLMIKIVILRRIKNNAFQKLNLLLPYKIG